MPKTKLEGILFTTTMCLLMVTGMSAYNLAIHHSFSWGALFGGLITGFIVAFILDVFIVGKIAKSVAFKLPINKEKMLHKILAISGCMVTGMVLCMSFYGVVYEQGFSENFLMMYLTAIGFNIIAALPLQLLIVGPISRKLLGLFQGYTAKSAVEFDPEA
ncbi:DUF2798 domain-containing protein [Enterococcus sp. LJL90]